MDLPLHCEALITTMSVSVRLFSLSKYSNFLTSHFTHLLSLLLLLMMRKHSEETNWASLQSGAQYSHYASDPVNKIAISKPRSNNLKLVLQQLFCGPLSAHFCLRLSPENPLLSSLNNFWSQSCVDVLSSITASSVHCWLLVWSQSTVSHLLVARGH